jgi:hypothetical protein
MGFRAAPEEAVCLMEQTQQVGHEQDDQYGAYRDAGASTVTPPAVAIISAANAKKQQQNDQQY